MPTDRVRLRKIGEFPTFPEIAKTIFGNDTDYDSDGDSSHPSDTDWTELTLSERDSEARRIDIDPDPHEPEIFVVKASDPELMTTVVRYLRSVGAFE